MSNRFPGAGARPGTSLPETHILLLLVMVAVTSLAALIWGGSGEDEVYAARHNLLKLRELVGQYQLDHLGNLPANLNDLTQSSNLQGQPSGGAEITVDFPVGPYLSSLPENSMSQGPTRMRTSIRLLSRHPAEARDVTPSNQGGWLYNPRTGGVWVDHSLHFQM